MFNLATPNSPPVIRKRPLPPSSPRLTVVELLLPCELPNLPPVTRISAGSGEPDGDPNVTVVAAACAPTAPDGTMSVPATVTAVSAAVPESVTVSPYSMFG